MPTSADTVLRLLHRHPTPDATTPRVLVVDDWAWRRGKAWGTILVDLERRRPVDLLPDRTSDSLATWLRAHPAVDALHHAVKGFEGAGHPGGRPAWP